jgi:hypothetical protein
VCRRIFMTFLFACVLLFGIGAAVLGYLYWDITRTEPGAAGGQVSADSSARAPGGATTPQRTLERLEEEFRGTPAPGGQGNQFRVRLTEAEANDLIHSQPEVRKTLADYNISDLRVQFEPGRLIAGARVPLFGNVQARVTVRGRLWAEQGRLMYETESVSAGSFPAPGPLRDELDRQLKAVIQQLDRSLEGDVTGVNVTHDALEVEGFHGGR